ncbi:MAG: hypothetical protein HOP02_09735 [Methylococcaceae bacterium]|nr:hypothetical protein [Methylococcaceae bacterium]
MSDSQFIFEIKVSRTLLICLSVLHLLALAAALSNTLPSSVRILLSLLIMAHFGMQWRRYRHPINPITLMYNDSLGWSRLMKGITVQIQILPFSIITPFLIIVYYQQTPASVSIATAVCFKDALAQAAFRQLCVQLKITGAQHKAGDR